LARLRKKIPELRDGNLEHVTVTFNEDQRWLAMIRGPITIAINLGDRTCGVPFARTEPRSILAASNDDVVLDVEYVKLPRDSVAVIGPE